MFATPKAKVGRSTLRGSAPLSSAIEKKSAPSAVAIGRTELILEEGSNFVVRSLNSPVPVQVQEALRTASKVGGVKLHECGWAWLVVGSKLLLWRYTSSQLTTKCYQVALPASRESWNADLVTVLPSSVSEVSLLACSPDGCFCWWKNIITSSKIAERSYVDVGEGAVVSVLSLPVGGCLVTSSLCSMWVVTHQSEGGLLVRSVAMPHASVFSGFSRRVSSLFFGSQSASEVQDIRRVLTYKDEVAGTLALALTTRNLRRWQISQFSEEVVSDVDVVSLLKDLVLVAGWIHNHSDLSLQSVDMQLCDNNIAILFEVSSDTLSTFGVGVFPVLSEPSPASLKNIIKLDLSTTIEKSVSLHGVNSEATVLVLSRRSVLFVDVNTGLVSQSAALPGLVVGVGGTADQMFVFTESHGVVSVSHVSSSKSQHEASVSRLSTSVVATPLPKASQRSTVAEESVAESAEILENAFSQYLEGDIAGAISSCDDHFPIASFAQCLNTLGDAAVFHLSQRILDDPPPQINPTLSDGQGDTHEKRSIIIIYHLQQKMEAHNKYVQFLKDVGLLDRLTCLAHREKRMPTRKLLCEHGELLQSALTLRKQHNNTANDVINLVRPSSHPSLSRHDAFYTDISLLHNFFPALIQHQKRSLHGVKAAREKVGLLLSASTLMDSMLRDAVLYRRQKASFYDSGELYSGGMMQDYVPWTCEDDIRNSVTEQLELLLDVGLTQDVQENGSLWNIILSLVDTLFDGYKAQLESFRLSNTPKKRSDDVMRTYQAHRTKYLNIIMDHHQLQAATELAERYEDYGTLVALCQRLGNPGQLKEYMSRFSEQGFSDFLFKLFLNEGQLQHLLSFSKEFPTELGSFLESHSSLSWLHHIATQDYCHAYKTLKQLADQEARCAGRKKTYLSLSKLSLLASRGLGEGTSDQLAELNGMLQHIAVQEKLPLEVMEAANMDYDTMPPLLPQRIVELFVGELNPASTEEHFLLALEYLHFSSASLDELTLHTTAAYIWATAILKDNWTQMSTDDVLTELKKTFFYRIWSASVNQKWHLLPDLTKLLQCSLLVREGLHKNQTFLYFMTAAKELMAQET